MLPSLTPSCPVNGDAPPTGSRPARDLVPRWVVHTHDLLGSTSDEARRLACQGAPQGTTVWAKAQTAGRGRRGRAWSSPEGNLHVSVVLHSAEAVASQLGFVAALAVADAVDEVCGRAWTRLKWPNDVLLDGAKLAGMLLEVEHTAWGMAVVLGIGVNLRHFPGDVGYAATSLRAHGVEVDAQTMLAGVLKSLGARLDFWHEKGFCQIRAEWSKRGHQPDTALRINVEGRRVDATFVGLDSDGSLLVRINGRIERFPSAEIVSV